MDVNPNLAKMARYSEQCFFRNKRGNDHSGNKKIVSCTIRVVTVSLACPIGFESTVVDVPQVVELGMRNRHCERKGVQVQKR
jgi:hypothetical protein